MKNNDPDKSILKRKGFYVALYSVVGVAMLLAIVVSLRNLGAIDRLAGTSPEDDQRALQQAGYHVDFSELQPTGQQNRAGSYFVADDLPDAEARRRPIPASEPEGTPPAEAQPQADGPEADAMVEVMAETPDDQVLEVGQGMAIGELVTDEEVLDAIRIPREESAIEVSPSFTAFTDDTRMIWPVAGEIVMEFSMDRLIHDKTLDQFRTNDNICISADLGSQVLAAAEGKVQSVSRCREHGNAVVIDHGNGWVTTYRQLQDGVLVQEGDIVRSGQVIGGVGSPSIYSVLLGNHVSFQVARNDEIIDPRTILE